MARALANSRRASLRARAEAAQRRTLVGVDLLHVQVVSHELVVVLRVGDRGVRAAARRRARRRAGCGAAPRARRRRTGRARGPSRAAPCARTSARTWPGRARAAAAGACALAGRRLRAAVWRRPRAFAAAFGGSRPARLALAAGSVSALPASSRRGLRPRLPAFGLGLRGLGASLRPSARPSASRRASSAAAFFAAGFFAASASWPLGFSWSLLLFSSAIATCTLRRLVGAGVAAEDCASARTRRACGRPSTR